MNFYSKYLTSHFLHIFLFLCITLLYCYPIFDGKKIDQSDFKQFLGMSKEIVDFREDTGKEALWTNSMFGGMPAYQISVRHPNNVLLHIDKLLQLYLPRPIGIIFLYFIGFYILLLSCGINPNFSFLGSLAFGLSSYLFIILEAGHNTKAHAIAYMAPAIASMILIFTGKQNNIKIIGFLLAFLFLGLHLRANHLQITYYLLFILFTFWVNYFYIFYNKHQLGKFANNTLLFFIAGILAVLINIGNIWSTYEYSKYSVRGKSELVLNSQNQTSGLDKDYATAWSYGKLETFNLLFPNFFGGSSHTKLSDRSNVYLALRKNGVNKRDSQAFIKNVPLYWGPQSFTSGPVYIGSVVWLLFFIGLFTIKKPIKWLLCALLLFSLILAWGKHLPFITNLFLDHFPLYNKFRTVSMILIIVQFIVPFIGILGLYNFFLIKNLEKKDILIKSFTGLFVFSIFFYLFGTVLFDFKSSADSQFPSWFVDALMKDRIQLFKNDILRSLFFIISSSALIFVFKNKTGNKWVYILALLLVLDMWFVNKRYLNNDDFVLKSSVEKPFQLQEYDKLIKSDTSIYRVYNLNERLDQGARTSYFHQSLGGYHGAKMGRYQEVIDTHLSKGNMNVINMLNTKYIISQEKNQPFVSQNPSALGNVWLIDSIIWVNNANEELDALSDFEPASMAIINKKYNNLITDPILSNVNDSIELVSYSPNKLIYNCNNKNNVLAVFSEIFYPKGWNVFINNKPIQHFNVNYILRGMVIPPGQHEIVFEFTPKAFYYSARISLICSILLLSLIPIVCFRLFYIKE